MKEFYTIQEFAKIADVEVSKLRFYDKIGVFCPVKRDPDNNYRYYALTQILMLNFITVLSELNIPLKTISALRDKRRPEGLLRLLEKQEKQLDMDMRLLRQRYSIIHARRELITYGLISSKGFWALDGERLDDGDDTENSIRVDENVISILRREDKEYFLWPRNEYNEGDTFIQPFASFISKIKEFNINLNFPVGGYWESMAAFTASPTRPEHFVTIDPLGTRLRKEGHYMIGFNRGSYGDMGDLPEKMNNYAIENSVTFSGPVLVMYLFDEFCTSDDTQFLAQICAGISRPKRRKAVK